LGAIPAPFAASCIRWRLGAESVSGCPEQLRKVNRKWKKKGCNLEWTSPADPDARIAKMKDGRTHLAHKAEHAVDLASGALLAITLQPAGAGDTHTLGQTLEEAQSAARQIDQAEVREVVADKGYHSGPALTDLHQQGVRSYIPDPDRGQQALGREGKAEEQEADVRESATGEGRPRQTAAKGAQRTGGEKFRAPVRHRGVCGACTSADGTTF
jgi:hypothetical protein